MTTTRSRKAFILLAGIFAAVLIALSPTGNAHAATISKAVWNQTQFLLQVAGSGWGNGTTVTITDAGTGGMLGTVRASALGSWTLSTKISINPPCTVRATAGATVVDKAVTNAPTTCSSASDLRTFAFNNLGMHCYDADFSVFSILPPFNTVNAQVVRAGSATTNPILLDNVQAAVTYSAVADKKKSINTTSAKKTNFWTYVSGLFGVSPAVDTGLTGSKMPGTANVPQSFSVFDTAQHWFNAEGIPITNYDDKKARNPYPLMRIQARDLGSAILPAPISVVLPVSDEMHCSDCHTNGKAANRATMLKYGIAAWSRSLNKQVRYRQNILILHDAKRGTNLMGSTPVLCASCHYSPALDLAGTGPGGNQIGKPMLSYAVHGRHGKTVDNTIPGAGNPAIIPDSGVNGCYKCHPGAVTKCLRGAMGNAGITCTDCHGGMLAVGGQYSARTPWVDEPKCQSCHTGDALSHFGTDIRQRIAYDTADPAATPRIATNLRFAEETGKLYRNSLGHSNLACEACHGSTHAEWPAGNTNVNDNLVATQIQGHTGPIMECTVCHTNGPSLTLNGPHGLHNINTPDWNRDHSSFYRASAANCQTCHGVNLEGTVLSRAAANRSLIADDNRSVSIAKGTRISCTICHENPAGGGAGFGASSAQRRK